MTDDFSSRDVPLAEVLHTGCGTVHDFWNRKRGDRFAPRWDDFRLIELPPRIIPFIRVVDVLDGGRDFVYRFWGTGLSSVRALDRTGAHLSAIESPRTPTALAEYRRIVAEKSCIAIVYDARASERRQALHAPCIRLPLSDDGAAVDKIVCFSDFETDQREWRRFFEDRKTRS